MAVYTVTPQDQYDIAGLYAAFWNRAPDTTGFGFWVEKLASGVSLDEIATAFRNAPEGVAEYPLWSTNVELVTEVYANVFGRAPDTQGLLFWTGKLDSGQVTFPELVVDMCEAAMTNGSADGALFENKVEVGVYVATVAQTDNGYVCDNAFNQVTADPASVATAEAWVDANNTGATYTLTTNIDTINVEGHAVNTVNGVQQSTNGTWNTGDTINGNGLTKIALVANGSPTSIVDANDIAAVNINLTDGSGLNELEFTNVAAVTVTNGVGYDADSTIARRPDTTGTLTVTNADQATVHGFAKEGRAFHMSVDYSDTTGKADVAALSVAGTGTSTTDSQFDVADSNTVEAVTVATSGVNHYQVNGGTAAAKYTFTGNGVNDVVIGSAADTMTIDASANTGTNIIDVGTLLSTTDTVLGGSGLNVLKANLTQAVQLVPTVTDVDNVELTFTAAAIYNASKTTGISELELTPVGAVNATVTNLNQSATTVRVGEHYGAGAAITATGAVKVGYATGSASDVDFLVGAAKNTAGTAQAVSIGAVEFSGNAGDLTVNSVGSAANTIASLTANKATSLEIAGVDQTLTVTGIVSATNADSVTVDGTLKNTSTGALTVDASASTVNVTSGAGTSTVASITETAILTTENVDTTYNITAGAKNATVTGNIAVTDTVNLGDAVNVTTNVVSNGAGNATVGGTLSTTIGANVGDLTSTVNVEALSTGTATVAGVSIDEAASAGTSTLNLNIAATGANAGVTTLTLTDNDAGYLTVSAASGKTASIGSLVGGANSTLTGITVSGAGSVNLFNTASGVVGGDAVLVATALTGALNADLNNATGNLNVTLGNVASGTNVVITGDGNDVVTGGTGNDSIAGGAGADSLVGSTGTNTYSAVNTNGVVEVVATAQSVGQVINLSAATLTAANIKTAMNADYITANEALDVASNRASYLFAVVDKAATNSTVTDVLSGFANATGSAGIDYIVGSASANTITGSLSADRLTGGDGADTFAYTGGTNAAVGQDAPFVSALGAAGYTATAAATAAIAANAASAANSVFEVITDIAAGDVINMGNASLAVAGTQGQQVNNTYTWVSGTWDNATQTFTVGASLATGADTLLLFDADSAATLNNEQVVLVGVTSAEMTAATISSGLLTF